MQDRSVSRRSILQLLASVPLLLLLPSGRVRAARVRIQTLRIWPDPEKTRLVFDLDGDVAFKPPRVSQDPPKVTLSISAAEIADRSFRQRAFPQDPLLKNLRAIDNAESVDFIIDLRREVQATAFHLPPSGKGRGHRLVLDLIPRWTNEEQEVREREVRRVRESRHRIVAIDPGHGGEDPGTTCWSDRGTRLEEKDIALAVGLALRKEIESRFGGDTTRPGLRAILTREGDYFVPLAQRPAIARKYGADLFVSLHVNSAPSDKARGAEVFFLSLQGAEDTAARQLVERENAADLVGGVPPDMVDAPLVDILVDMKRNVTMRDSERLADVLLQNLDRVQGAQVRAVKQGPLAVLKSIEKPSVLVELGFFTNTSDRRLLDNRNVRRQYAALLAEGIASYLA